MNIVFQLFDIYSFFIHYWEYVEVYKFSFDRLVDAKMTTVTWHRF